MLHASVFDKFERNLRKQCFFNKLHLGFFGLCRVYGVRKTSGTYKQTNKLAN